MRASLRIASTHNPTVKYVRSLERASVRREYGEYLVEGVRLVGEAVATGQTAGVVLYDRESLLRSAAGSNLLNAIPQWVERSYETDHRVLAAAAQTETPGGVIATLRLPGAGRLSEHHGVRLGLILDGVGDPGNAGTLLRTADAFGVGYVVALEGSVDLFSPKVVRAGMGAHFRLPIHQEIGIDTVLKELPDTIVIAAAANDGEILSGFVWPEHAALVIGSEAHGLSGAVRAAVARRVYIPMRTGVESLNAAIAASILMYAALGTSSEPGML